MVKMLCQYVSCFVYEEVCGADRRGVCICRLNYLAVKGRHSGTLVVEMWCCLGSGKM